MGFMATGFVIGLMCGLWWGERSRRIDAQRAIGAHRPTFARRPVVTEDVDVAGTPMEAMMTDEQIERMVQDTMNETGCNRKEAEEDVTRLLSAGAIMGLEH